MALTKVGPKFQVTIPKEAREAARIKVGDLIEAEVKRRVIVLRPKVLVDKAFIEKRLAAAEEDIKKGRVYGPFKSAKALIRSLHREAKKLKKKE